MDEVRSFIQRAAGLWLSTCNATSSQGRNEFGRLALLYERVAVRIARRELQRSTLGDLLLADEARGRRTEAEWVGMLRGIAQGDRRAFQTLYLWTHRVVLALLMAITEDWDASEDLTVLVFDSVWHGAGGFEPMGDTVLGWILGQARARALVRVHGQVKRTDETSVQRAFEALIEHSETALLSSALWRRILQRLDLASGRAPALDPAAGTADAGWEQPGPGLWCKILAMERPRGRLSMLMRLMPGKEYPAHTHAGLEELHLLHGELRIDERKLHRGDYIRREPGTADQRIWSDTGCTAVLITSSRDILG